MGKRSVVVETASKIAWVIGGYGFVGICYELLCCFALHVTSTLSNTDLPVGYPVFNPLLWLAEVPNNPNAAIVYVFPVLVLIAGLVTKKLMD